MRPIVEDIMKASQIALTRTIDTETTDTGRKHRMLSNKVDTEIMRRLINSTNVL